ncbi:hypothetical protein FIBSPDRAFT_81151 [Athelia psychrophila]|uniref:Uncharacterized protein n=1 Tax=Athelia psychrophila TaxID=1759441 RepID=A0A166EAC9_9AGAM|nr:hypothetical protein FIBSPDRAFT_81151 [Fibularhizoctonia sp. CBS 109695]
MIFFCCCAQRRRQYAVHQNPGVTPPLFGTAPPAYGMPFWTGNMQAQQPAPPYAPPANGGNPFGTNDVEANTTGGYGYGQENGGVGGIHYPPPPAINQGSRPNEPPSYFNAGKGPGPMPNQEGDDVGASGSYAPVSVFLLASSIEIVLSHPPFTVTSQVLTFFPCTFSPQSSLCSTLSYIPISCASCRPPPITSSLDSEHER